MSALKPVSELGIVCLLLTLGTHKKLVQQREGYSNLCKAGNDRAVVFLEQGHFCKIL